MTETYDPVQKFTAIESTIRCRTTPDYLMVVLTEFNSRCGIYLPHPAISVYHEDAIPGSNYFGPTRWGYAAGWDWDVEPKHATHWVIKCVFQDGDRRWLEEIGWYTLLPTDSSTTLVRLKNSADHPYALAYFRTLEKHLRDLYDVGETVETETDPVGGRVEHDNRRGMSDWRKQRANLFKQLKGDEPSLSQADLATKATEAAFDQIRQKLSDAEPGLNGQKLETRAVEEFSREYHGSEFGDDDVRNDYEAMNWKWERADRIR